MVVPDRCIPMMMMGAVVALMDWVWMPESSAGSEVSCVLRDAWRLVCACSNAGADSQSAKQQFAKLRYWDQKS